MVVSLLLFACNECLSLDEISVMGVAATPDGETAVRQGIAELGAWVGPDATCVGEVYIQDEGVPEGAGGAYHPVTGGIYLRPDTPLAEVTRHELCHALDHQAGWASLDHPDLFREETVDELDLYPTVDERVVEAFARACEDGPEPVVLAETLADSCGGVERLAPMRFLLDHTYLAWEELGTEPAGWTDLALRRAPLPHLGVRSGPVIGAGGLYVLTDELVHIDLDSGAIVEAVPVPQAGGTLIGGDEGPVLDVAGQAWLWRKGAWAPLGDVQGTPSPGLLLDGDVWAAQEDGAWLIRPGEGVVGVVEAEDWGVPWGAITMTPQGYALATDGWIRTFDARARAWSTVEGPVGWDIDQAVPLPGGLVAVSWEDDWSWEPGYTRAGLAIGNPADGRWWLADEPCWADAISPDHVLLVVDGALYVWETGGWDASDASYGPGGAITRVEWG